MILWGNMTRIINGGNVLGGVAYNYRAGSEASNRVSMSFLVYIYIYICCNAGRGLGGVT